MTTTVTLPSAPRMPEPAVARLRELLEKSSCYLEYGAGGSTVLANSLGVPVSISVESDNAWLDVLRREMAIAPSAERIFLHADIGPTGEWGHPISEDMWRSWHDYPLIGWKECRSRFLSPDLVLIDGRFRMACFYATLIFAKAGATILFDDYVDRPFYHSIERSLRPIATHARMAEFQVPANTSRDLLWLAFCDAITDKR